jgi:hypothetical protein
MDEVRQHQQQQQQLHRCSVQQQGRRHGMAAAS